MPTPTEVLYNIAPIANYLASNTVSNGALFGTSINPLLPIQIYVETKSVQAKYDDENIAGGNIPSPALIGAANYLYSILGRFGSLAESVIINSGAAPIPSGTVISYSIPKQFPYTALVDGETALPVSLPIGSIIFQVQKSILTLIPSQWSYANPVLTLLGGISMSQDEVLNIFYVYPI